MAIVYRAGLSDSEIASLQSKLRPQLPDEYKRFLKKMNGFYFSDPDFPQLPVSEIDEDGISFDRMFGISPAQECNDLASFNREFAGELSFLTDVLIIGDDGGGNPYVLIGSPGKKGVYYWDRTHLHDRGIRNISDIAEQGGCGNLYWVAESVEDLYSSLILAVGGEVTFIEEP